MKTVCFIPARGGSVRIPRKNIRMFHGKPIIAYAIENAQKCGLFDEIVVSTDDDEIEQVAWTYGALVVRRPTDDGSTGTQELAAAYLKDRPEIGICCVLYATTPLLEWFHLAQGWQALMDGRTLQIYSVDPDGADIGGFYWGFAQAVRDGFPLTHLDMVGLPRERCCDINLIEDWHRAESMYDALRRAA